MRIFNIDFCFDLSLFSQRHFTADKVIESLVARPDRLRNLPDRGSQILTIAYRLLNIALCKELINGIDMLGLVVIQIVIALIGEA